MQARLRVTDDYLGTGTGHLSTLAIYIEAVVVYSCWLSRYMRALAACLRFWLSACQHLQSIKLGPSGTHMQALADYWIRLSVYMQALAVSRCPCNIYVQALAVY